MSTVGTYGVVGINGLAKDNVRGCPYMGTVGILPMGIREVPYMNM